MKRPLVFALLVAAAACSRSAPPVVTPLLAQPDRTVTLTVWSETDPVATAQTDNGPAVECRTLRLDPAGSKVFCDLAPANPNGFGATVTVSADGYVTETRRFVTATTSAEYPQEIEGIALKRAAPPVVARHGAIRFIGKAWADDDGPFYPLGRSLFWELGAWMKGGDERARAARNAAWAKQEGADYVRVFYYVDWRGQPYGGVIRGTPEGLGELLEANSAAGLRTKVTVSGGGDESLVALTREVISAVAPRRQTLLFVECVNEQNESEDDAVACGRLLAAAGIPCAVGYGDAGPSKIADLTERAGCNVSVLHTERTDPSTRRDRQAWDFHELRTAAESGEPAGPASSVGQEEDPLHLAFQRIGAIVMGAGAYTYHDGSGIYGVTYQSPYGTRYANLWERQRPELAQALRGVDRIIRHTGVENWPRTNGCCPPWLPMVVQSGHVDKQMYARSGKDFIGLLTDTDGPLTFKPNEPIESFTLYNPLTGAVQNGGIPAHLVIGRIQ